MSGGQEILIRILRSEYKVARGSLYKVPWVPSRGVRKFKRKAEDILTQELPSRRYLKLLLSERIIWNYMYGRQELSPLSPCHALGPLTVPDWWTVIGWYPYVIPVGQTVAERGKQRQAAHLQYHSLTWIYLLTPIRIFCLSKNISWDSGRTLYCPVQVEVKDWAGLIRSIACQFNNHVRQNLDLRSWLILGGQRTILFASKCLNVAETDGFWVIMEG